MGVDSFLATTGSAVSLFIAVANSGDNSVSVFASGDAPKLVQVLTGIPAPYGLTVCGNKLVVTSPSDNSVWVLSVSSSGVLSVAGRVPTGAQPIAVSCGLNGAIVSNVGDSTLALLDLASLRVTATIPGVAGARVIGGLFVTTVPTTSIEVAWVAGTEANILTAVDVRNAKILTRIPLPRPTRVGLCGLGSGVCIGSGSTGNIAAIDPVTFASLTGSDIYQYQTVPNLQDFIILSGYIGTSTEYVINLAISVPDSLWYFDLTLYPGTTGPIANIPGLAALRTASLPTRPGHHAIKYVLATSTNTNSLVVITPTSGPQPPFDFRVSNAASFAQPPLAAGSLASLFGATGLSQSTNVSGLPLPTAISGVTVKIGGTLNYGPTGWGYSPSGSIPAPLLFVGPNQVNFQVPPEIPVGPYVQAQLTLANGNTQLTTVAIAAASPGVFALSQSGVGQGAVLNQDFSQNGSSQVLSGARPAVRGEVIHIFCTGGGETLPLLLPGEAAPASGNPLVVTKVQPSVWIDGLRARVLFSGLAPGFVGLWQIDAEVPKTVTPGSVVPLFVTTTDGGFSSPPRPGQSNTVTIAVQ